MGKTRLSNLTFFQLIQSRVINQMPLPVNFRPAAHHAELTALVGNFLHHDLVTHRFEGAVVIAALKIKVALHLPIFAPPVIGFPSENEAVGPPGQALQREDDALHLESTVPVKPLVELGKISVGLIGRIFSPTPTRQCEYSDKESEQNYRKTVHEFF